MQSNNFDMSSAINKIVDFSPVVLFTMLFLVLSLTGYLQQHFYNNVFAPVLPETEYLAFVFPVVIQVLRLVTGFLSASFFKKRKFVAGIAVLIFSIWITMFEHQEAKVMGEYWVNLPLDLSTVAQADVMVEISQHAITSMMHILIWGALFLEIFLAIWVSSKPARSSPALVADPAVFSSNGAGKKKGAPVS